MARVVFHPEASREFRAALLWYGRQSRRAAQGLQREVERVVAILAATPDRYPFYDDTYHEAALTRFPYSLIYRVRPDGDMLIIAVAHASREPGYWQGRD